MPDVLDVIAGSPKVRVSGSRRYGLTLDELNEESAVRRVDEVDTQVGNAVHRLLEHHRHTLLAQGRTVCVDVVELESDVMERAAATFQPALQGCERGGVVARFCRNDELELTEQIAVALELRDVSDGNVSGRAVLTCAGEEEQRLEERLIGTDDPDVMKLRCARG
jgi:hypothetical protein